MIPKHSKTLSDTPRTSEYDVASKFKFLKKKRMFKRKNPKSKWATVSITFNLQMTSIDTFQDTLGCRGGPRDNQRQNDLAPPVNCQPSHWREGS